MTDHKQVAAYVRRRALTHPSTLGAMAVVAGGALGTMMLGGWASAAVAAGGLAMAAASWFFHASLQRDRLIGRYLGEVHEQAERLRLERLGALRATLYDCAQVPVLSRHASQGLGQYQNLREKHELFTRLLERKFLVNELSYGRYVAAVDAAFDAVIANLSTVTDLLGIVRSIDIDDIRSRLRALGKQGPEERAGGAELATLEERAALWQTQIDGLDRLLLENERALTSLLEVMTAVSRIRNLDASGTLAVNTATQDLEALAKRARLFE